MRHRLALQPETQTQGTTGEVTSTYATEAIVWGSLLPMSGKELEQARQISEEISVKAVIRYYPALTTEYRIENDARVYEVANILNFREKDCFQTLMLKEVK